MTKIRVDKGWAWVIAFSSFWTMLTCFSIQRTAGVLYIAMMRQYHVTREEASWPFFLRKTVAMLAANIVGVLIKKFSIRSQITVGITLSAVGMAALFFADNITSVALLFGILYGLGSGVVTMCNIIAVNQFFCRYRTIAFGIMISGGPTGAFLFPPLIEYCIKKYGLQGTYLMLTGIVLQSYVVVSLYRTPPSQNQEVSEETRDGNSAEPNVVESPAQEPNLCLKTVKALLHIFRLPMFHIIWFSFLMFDFTFYTFLTIIVDYSIDCGITIYRAVFLLSACSIAELCGRLGSGWIIDLKLVERKNAIRICFFLKGVMFLAIPFLNNYILLISLTSAIGFFGSCLIINSSAVYAEYFGLEYLPLCVSTGATFNGLMSLITPSIIGYMRDATGNYHLLFYTSAACLFVAAALWLLEPFFAPTQKTRRPSTICDATGNMQ